MVKPFRVYSILSTLILLLISCTANEAEPHASGTQEGNGLSYPPSLQATDQADVSSAYPAPTPTMGATSPPLPTVAPTPTTPPMPTALPTPIVTVIPTLTPGTFTESAAPFWIYYWHDDQIWRVDSEGNGTQLLLDVHETLGKTLKEITAYPEHPVYSGPRVTMSPSGTRLALVTADSVDDASYNYSVYTYDVPSGAIASLGSGRLTAWAPDSERLAFVKNETIQVVNIATGKTEQVADQIQGRISELSWSADSQYLLYVHDVRSASSLGIWLVDVTDPSQSRQLLTSEWTAGALRPLPDTQSVLFLSTLGSHDVPYSLTQNLWSLSMATDEAVQLTQHMWINNFRVSPDGQWILLNGFQMHVSTTEAPQEELWLLELGGNGNLFRLPPTDQDSVRLIGWSPGGGKWISTYNVSDDTTNLVVTSGDDFSQRELSFPVNSQFIVGGAVRR